MYRKIQVKLLNIRAQKIHYMQSSRKEEEYVPSTFVKLDDPLRTSRTTLEISIAHIPLQGADT